MTDHTKLKALALAATGWKVDHIIPATDEEPCKVGCLDGDGNFCDLITLDCEDYYGDSVPLANYIVAANPAAVLALIAENEALRTQHEDLQNVYHLQGALNRKLKTELRNLIDATKHPNPCQATIEAACEALASASYAQKGKV